MNSHGEIRSIEQQQQPLSKDDFVRLQRALQSLDAGEYAYWAARVATIVIDNYNALAPDHKGEEITSIDMVELRRLMRMLWGDEKQDWLLEGDIWPDETRYGENVPVVGAVLYNERTKREMSQASLSELTGINRREISRIEKGNQVVRVQHLERIAEAFNVPIDELLREATNKK